jgi:hypothetical protein
VDEDLRAQVKARRVSRRAQAWRARARVMWTGLKSTNDDACSIIDPLHEMKIMLPEDDTVRSKHVVDIF